MNRIYDKLRNNEYFKDKLKIDDSKNCLTITFNEYLYLDYFEGNYKAASDEGLILLNDNLTHWHITDDEEVFEIMDAFANGDVVCIKGKNFFSSVKIKIMEKEKFEKRKERYMTKKSLRIYTGNAIIKRSG